VGLDVDDFEAVLVKARELGVLDTGTFGSAGVRRLLDGAVQMYVRDPRTCRASSSRDAVSDISARVQSRTGLS
jgi:hypothetical protein